VKVQMAPFEGNPE